jgi:hypothetical protein
MNNLNIQEEAWQKEHSKEENKLSKGVWSLMETEESVRKTTRVKTIKKKEIRIINRTKTYQLVKQ